MPTFTDFKSHTEFAPTPTSVTALHAMLDQMLPWTKAMELVRSGNLTPAPCKQSAATAYLAPR